MRISFHFVVVNLLLYIVVIILISEIDIQSLYSNKTRHSTLILCFIRNCEGNYAAVIQARLPFMFAKDEISVLFSESVNDSARLLLYA